MKVLNCRYAVRHISSYEYDRQRAVIGTNVLDDKAISTFADSSSLLTVIVQFNLLKPTGHVMHQHNCTFCPHCICVLYLSENKQRLVSLTA